MPGRVRGLLLAPVLVATLLAGGPATAKAPAGASSTPDRTESAHHAVTARAGRASVPRYKRALRIARRQIGDRYAYGAEGPNRFDCSGLVYYSTHRAGLKRVPRTSSEQADFMRRIPRRHLRRGDYLFFTGSSGVYHVGMFIGRRNGSPYILHAPEPGARVRRERVWTNSWFAGTLRG
jgi:cell wall-associated NlpC family hydrolase